MSVSKGLNMNESTKNTIIEVMTGELNYFKYRISYYENSIRSIQKNSPKDQQNYLIKYDTDKLLHLRIEANKVEAALNDFNS